VNNHVFTQVQIVDLDGEYFEIRVTTQITKLPEKPPELPESVRELFRKSND
jgi:hypothetical protein